MSKILNLLSDITYKLSILREKERNALLKQFSIGQKKFTSNEVAIIEILYKNENCGQSKTPFTKILQKIENIQYKASYADIVYKLGKDCKENPSADLDKKITAYKNKADQALKSKVSQAITKLQKGEFITKTSDHIHKPIIELTEKGWGVGYSLDHIDRFLILKLLAKKNVSEDFIKAKLEGTLSEALDMLTESDKREKPTDAMLDANTARVYDLLTGGQFYFPIDEQVVNVMKEKVPFVAECAKANRAFMRRAVSFLADKGITQFIDIGSGILSHGNIHEILSDHDVYKVLYVDFDPYVNNVSSYIISGIDNVKAINARFDDVENILNAATAKGLEMDLSKPVAVIGAALIHFMENLDHAKKTLKKYFDKLHYGSCFVISHAHAEESNTKQIVKEASSGKIDDVIKLYSKNVRQVYKRTESEIEGIFNCCGLKLLPPYENKKKAHLVFAPEWRHKIKDKYLFGLEPPLEKTPEKSFIFVGVGEKQKSKKK